MKILLINANTENTPYPVSPIGLSMVATAVQNAGYEVKMLDGFWNEEFKASLTTSPVSEIISAFQPDVIGLSIRNIDDMVMEKPRFYLDEIEEMLIKPIREYRKAITVLGGAGFSLFPNQLMDLWKFDFGVVGHGEHTFVELLHALKNKTETIEIKGLLMANKSIGTTDHLKSGQTENHQTTKSGLQLPYSQIDTHLNYGLYGNRTAYPIQTKRGCALKCIYCSYPTIEGKTYQLRSAVDVVDEIESVIDRLGKVTFEFVDSTFNHPKGHAEKICEEIIRRKLQVRLRTMGVHPSAVTPKLISLMTKAGFAQIDCTPDSGSDKMLKMLRKGFRRKKLIEVTKILKDANMPTMWFFVLGGPGETHETLTETFDFIENHIDENDLVHLTEGLRIYPNTGLEEYALSEGLIKKDDSLLLPRFYVSPSLGTHALKERVLEFTKRHHNCLRSVESAPTPEMISQAMKYRKENNLEQEPMFRSLLRIRKAMLTTAN